MERPWLPVSKLGKVAAIGGSAVVLLLVVSQLVLPGLGEKAIRDRLTEHGGSADVSLSALPAATLLWGNGEEIDVHGTGLHVDLATSGENVFENLDHFGKVDIALSDTTAGPFQISTFELNRDGGDTYTVMADAEASISDLAKFGADSAGIPGGSILDFALGVTQVGDQDVPVTLDMKMVSDDGRIRITEGGGHVAGIPTGPLAELITSAIAVKI